MNQWVLAIGYVVIYWLLFRSYYYLMRYYDLGVQPIREDGPNHHHQKTVITMGGIIFLLAGLNTSVLSQALWGFGLLGLYDDLSKVYYKNTYRGLSPRLKFIGQWMLALWLVMQIPHNDYVSVFGYPLYLGVMHPLFSAFVIVASSNAYNLIDGVDGLAATQGLLLVGFFLFVALQNGYVVVSQATVLLAASLLAFLCYNWHPAKIFMGDVGSLSVGAFLGVCAILLKVEFLFALVSFVLVFETISVFIQVVGYKMGYGRIFKMAPFHHHLELSGWKEIQIVLLAGFVTSILIAIICYLI